MPVKASLLYLYEYFLLFCKGGYTGSRCIALRVVLIDVSQCKIIARLCPRTAKGVVFQKTTNA